MVVGGTAQACARILPEFDRLAARSGFIAGWRALGTKAGMHATTSDERANDCYGTCNSVVASDPTSLAPPASSTLPSGSRVAVWK
jgi:hypothetical protein